jgi:hypothetical protein
MVGLVGLFVCASMAPGWADDIYRWTDASGGVHFSNTPTVGDIPERVTPGPMNTAEATQPAPPQPAAGADGEIESPPRNAAPSEVDTAFSTSASLRRNDLERDLRTTEKRLRELDGQLRTLTSARSTHVGGSAATGGVGTSMDVRSEEEKALTEEREKLAQHAADVRNEAVKLREEVVAKLGSQPAWCIDVR